MPGSKKGRKLSPEARARIAEAARNRQYKPGSKEKLAEKLKAQRADPEFEARRVAALQEALIGTTCPPDCPCKKHSIASREAASRGGGSVSASPETKAKIGAGSKAAWAKKTPEERSEIAWQRIKKYGVAKVSQAEYALAPHLAALGYTHNDDRALCVGRKFPDFYDLENKRLFEYFGNYWHPRREEAEEVIDYYRLLGWECEVLWEEDFYDWVREHPVNGFQKPPALK